MNRDPLDSLRSRNPVPPESLPSPPMGVARAITSGRPTLRRGLGIAAAASALVLVGGGSWLLWSRGGVGEVAGGVGSAAPATTYTTLPPSAIGAYQETPELVVYFWKDDGLVAVARDLSVLNVRPLPDLGLLAADLLLSGPGAWDAGPLPGPVAAAEAQLATAIPAGTRVRGLTVEDGVAVVDLSAEFADAPPQAVVQVVFTLTGAHQEAGAVRFLIEGEPQVVTTPLSGAFEPHLAAAATTAGFDSVTRDLLSLYLPPVMIENPGLGAILRLPATIAGVTTETDAEILLHLVDEDGALVWQATAPGTCPGCPAGAFSAQVPASVDPGTGWFTLRAYLSTFDRGPLAEHPVWLVPYVPSPGESEVPEATTSTTPTDPGSPPEGAAPWAHAPLAADGVPEPAATTWAAAEGRDHCALLFPADPASLADDALLHDRYFSGDWGLAWDLPSGPGRWEPGGDYCPDCGREAFGVAGVHYPGLTGDEDAIWPRRLSWPDGSHAGYGYEGLTGGTAGEPVLAYLFVAGQDCMYNVWSFLGEEHLLALIDQLRFVEGMGAP